MLCSDESGSVRSVARDNVKINPKKQSGCFGGEMGDLDLDLAKDLSVLDDR